MVVVPALTERDQGEKQAVLAVIARVVTLSPQLVGERVDETGAMKQHHCADEEPPDQHLPPTQQEEAQR